MDNLLNKFKPEVIDNINKYLYDAPHLKSIINKELAETYYIDDLKYSTYYWIYNANNLKTLSDVYLLLKDDINYDTTNNG